MKDWWRCSFRFTALVAMAGSVGWLNSTSPPNLAMAPPWTWEGTRISTAIRHESSPGSAGARSKSADAEPAGSDGDAHADYGSRLSLPPMCDGGRDSVKRSTLMRLPEPSTSSAWSAAADLEPPPRPPVAGVLGGERRGLGSI